MADVKWIKITTDIFDDEKILLIESLPDSYAIITCWFKLLCLAGKQNNNGVFMMGRIAYTDKMLATIFRMKESTVTMALRTFEEFGMVEIVDGVITIPNWEKHQNLDKIQQSREQTRQRVARHREKQRLIASGNAQCNAECNTDVTPTEEDKNKNKNKNKIEKENKSVKENTRTLFARLIPDYLIGPSVVAKLEEWITYKTERKEPYKEQGLKTLLRQIENNCNQYGEQAVCNLIDDSMANGWKGIIFDRLKQARPQPRQQQQQPRRGGNVFLEMLGDDDI